MHVSVGPVSSASVHAWIDYARSVIDRDRTGVDDLESDVVDAFLGYLRDWEAMAADDDQFRWEIDLDPETAEYQVHAFHRIASHLAEVAERRGRAEQPPEASEFYLALVSGILDALELEDSASTEFADHLRNFWPGLTDDPR